MRSRSANRWQLHTRTVVLRRIPKLGTSRASVRFPQMHRQLMAMGQFILSLVKISRRVHSFPQWRLSLKCCAGARLHTARNLRIILTPVYFLRGYTGVPGSRAPMHSVFAEYNECVSFLCTSAHCSIQSPDVTVLAKMRQQDSSSSQERAAPRSSGRPPARRA